MNQLIHEIAAVFLLALSILTDVLTTGSPRQPAATAPEDNVLSRRRLPHGNIAL